MLTITEHTNLESRAIQGVGWSRVSDLEQETRAVLKGVTCIEARIDGLREDQFHHENAFQQLDEIALSWINQEPVFLVSVTLPSAKSQIKSHKGLFRRDGTILRSDFYEQEIETRGRSFFIIGTARLNKQNCVEVLALAHNRFRSFLIFMHSGDLKASSNRIVGTLVDSLRLEESFSINFPKVVAGLVIQDESLLVYGADGAAGDWLNLCLFTHRSSSTEWLKKLPDHRR